MPVFRTPDFLTHGSPVKPDDGATDMEAKEQAAGYVPIVFTQTAGKSFDLDRYRIRVWPVRGKVRVELVDRGPQINGTGVDAAIDSGTI